LAKIAFFEVEDWEKDYLCEHQLCDEHDVHFFEERLHEKHLPDLGEVDVLSPFIYSQVNAEIIGHMPNLRLIATRSTGFDHIDLEAAKAAEVAVVNVPAYGDNTVAEHTFALILSLSRNVHRAYVRTLRSDFNLEGLKGIDIRGKTLGVVGTGRIGLHVIKIGRGFGMRVLAYDLRHNDLMAEILGFTYVPLEQLLAESDVVSLHLPYMPATHHLINAERLAMMKRGAILINTSRGGLVDTSALLDALESGHLRGAGLDVLEGETALLEERQLLASDAPQDALRDLLRSHLLLRREDVVFTPHIAFFSEEALRRILDTTVENIVRFLAGKPQNLVG
jgi:D-lactate dehydrogenase